MCTVSRFRRSRYNYLAVATCMQKLVAATRTVAGMPRHTVGGMDRASEQADRLVDEIRGRGARITTVRRAVLEVLAGTHEHLNAEEIAALVQADHPDVHVSTIYRNLDALEQLGVVEHTHLGHQPAVYHVGALHQHLVCEVCGRVIDVPITILDGLAEATRDYGFVLHPGHFALMGRCADHGPS
jgi:Fur family ferric uptake transcriptional regulator